jgi:4-amino-4-deoxy-L-arabinose transferase-like glycosyltransferase
MALFGHVVHCGIRAETGCGAAESQGGNMIADSAAVDPKSSFLRDTAFLWALALFSLFLHLATASRMDFCIDELYGVIILFRHAPMGYVDGSAFPLGLWLSWFPTLVLGSTKFAVRIFSAVQGSATILAAGLLARELGGGRFAVSVAGLGTFVTPILMFLASMGNTVSFESLPWALSAWLVVRILRTGNRRLWWLVGVAWGAGLMVKPTMILFILAVGFGLLLTRARGELLRKGYWLALVLAVVLFSPVLVWQTVHGWPFLRFMGAMSKDEWADSGFWLAYFSRSKLILAQPAFLGPLNCVLAAVGLFYSVVFAKEKRLQVVLWACMAVGLAFIVTSGRTMYWHPAYPILVAFGCVAVDRIAAEKRARWLRPALVFGLAVQGMVLAPVSMPLLPRDSLAGYSRFLCRGMLAPLGSTVEVLQGSDQYEMAARTFDRAYRNLSDRDRENCAIIIGWANLAAIVDFHGAQYHLPTIFSPHWNYSFWGPPGEGTEPILAAFFNRKELEGWFGQVECVDKFDGDPAPGIYLCRSPKYSYAEIWKMMCGKDINFRWKVDMESPKK